MYIQYVRYTPCILYIIQYTWRVRSVYILGVTSPGYESYPATKNVQYEIM